MYVSWEHIILDLLQVLWILSICKNKQNIFFTWDPFKKTKNHTSRGDEHPEANILT